MPAAREAQRHAARSSQGPLAHRVQERSVNDIVDAMEMEQPSVSKHLKVLKGVGLVEARREGRQMLYKVNAVAIRPLHEWTSTFERLWKHQLLRIKERAEANNAPKQ